MIPNRKIFHIGFQSIPEPVSDVWRTIVACLEKENCLPKTFSISQIAGHAEKYHSESQLKITPLEIVKLIDVRELTGFHCKTLNEDRGLGFDLYDMKENGTQSMLWLHLEEKTKAPADWTRLIEAILTQWDCIGGWQWQMLYQAWQWTSRRVGYERNYGIVPPDIKTSIQKSNDGIVPDKEVIDVSMNPGRKRDIFKGILFLPTSEMWLGPHFWQHAKCTKEEAMAADFFLEVRDTPHFLYLKSWSEPFTRPDGAQGRQQQRIWKLFFDEDCEWPPGSGGISEEPMYGPPELMP